MEAINTLQYYGCPLAWRVRGSGPPLVLIQGVAAYGLSPHNPQLEMLESRYACLSFDNRGCGRSLPAGRRVTVRHMAEDTLALMDAAGWESAHVVGHSLGGMVALQMALMARKRVRSLGLLCSFAGGAEVTAKLIWIGVRLRFGTRAMRERAFLEMVVAGETGGAKGKQLVRRLSEVIGHEVADVPPITSQQVAAARDEDLTPRLKELAGLPVLIVNGTEDPVAPPEAGQALASGIPGSKYVEVPGASHALPVLQAAECGGLLQAHLAKAEARRAGTK